MCDRLAMNFKSAFDAFENGQTQSPQPLKKKINFETWNLYEFIIAKQTPKRFHLFEYMKWQTILVWL